MQKIASYFKTVSRRTLLSAAVTAVVIAALLVGVVLRAVDYRKGIIDAVVLRRTLIYAANCVFLIALIFLAQRLFRIRFPFYLESTLVVFCFLCLGGGTVYLLYAKLSFWDKILHTLSGFLFTAFGLSAAIPLTEGLPSYRRRLAVCLIVAFFFSLAVGYVWEIYEYSVDSLFGSNLQRWQESVIEIFEDGTALIADPRGYAIRDTLTDMIVNLIGTVLFTVCVLAATLRRPDRLNGMGMKLRSRAQCNHARRNDTTD